MESQTVGQGLNYVPYGMQQQPDMAGVSPATEGMEAGRQAQEAHATWTLCRTNGNDGTSLQYLVLSHLTCLAHLVLQ